VVGTENGTLWRFNFATKKKNVTKGDPISCLAVSADGRTIAVGYVDENASANDRVNQGILHLIKTTKAKMQ
jgi:hypothetical protein